MKTTRLTLLIILTALTLITAACGGSATEAPAAAQPTTAAAAQPVPAQPAPQMPATDQPAVEAPDAAAAASECEEFFGFCATAEISGALTGAGSGGFGSSFDNDCAAWAAGGEPRILELPTMLAAGDNKITVALTRIGAYTGPGQYELAAQATSGNPDAFPSVEVAGRTFSNGDGSTAVVTIAADGSGSVQAAGLVEMASIQSSNPDPNALIDFSMQWTCQEES